MEREKQRDQRRDRSQRARPSNEDRGQSEGVRILHSTVVFTALWTSDEKKRETHRRVPCVPGLSVTDCIYQTRVVTARVPK